MLENVCVGNFFRDSGTLFHNEGEHIFSMFANFFEKLTFLVHSCTYQGVRDFNFSENLANVLNE